MVSETPGIVDKYSVLGQEKLSATAMPAAAKNQYSSICKGLGIKSFRLSMSLY